MKITKEYLKILIRESIGRAESENPFPGISSQREQIVPTSVNLQYHLEMIAKDLTNHFPDDRNKQLALRDMIQKLENLLGLSYQDVEGEDDD